MFSVSIPKPLTASAFVDTATKWRATAASSPSAPTSQARALRAFVNVCPHRAQPVALGDGRLFNAAGEIECQAHGARFDPLTGACVGGPCLGAALVPLPVAERDGAIWLLNGGA